MVQPVLPAARMTQNGTPMQTDVLTLPSSFTIPFPSPSRPLAPSSYPSSYPSASPAGSSPLARRIQSYWNLRAEGFGFVRRQELHSDKQALWWAEIAPLLPEQDRPLRVLDVGTGAGFLAILLARHKAQVSAVDSSQPMLEQAAALAAQEGCAIEFRQMEADRLAYAEGSFDCVLARNVTWTLLHPAAAYAEWQRVLRPGGVLINFDADYGSTDFTRLGDDREAHAHRDLARDVLQEGENIRKKLPLSSLRRPEWDRQILQELGFEHCHCDTDLSARIFAVRDATWNPVPMFALSATKRRDC